MCLARKTKKDSLIFNISFKKAHDFVKLIFSWNIDDLISGCPTQGINIQMRLKQGDMLTSLIFVLLVE